jgi:hypothetical protein
MAMIAARVVILTVSARTLTSEIAVALALILR